jgi:hypothetical protein
MGLVARYGGNTLACDCVVLIQGSGVTPGREDSAGPSHQKLIEKKELRSAALLKKMKRT